MTVWVCTQQDIEMESKNKPPFRYTAHLPESKSDPVPCALKEKVEQQLQRLENEGIIYKVSERTGLPQQCWSQRERWFTESV